MPSSMSVFRPFVSECLACKLMGPFPVANICDSCYAAIPRLHSSCLTCGSPGSGSVAICGQCLTNPPALDQCLIACPYVSPVDLWLRSMKDDHNLLTRPLLSQLLFECLKEQLIQQVELILPMPMHWSRRWHRGFNQCELLVDALAHDMELPACHTILRRSRRVKSQRGLNRKQRQKNQRDSFVLDAKLQEQIQGKNLLLVDDIITTSATANEAAKTLKAGGANRVAVAAVARTPSEKFNP